MVTQISLLVTVVSGQLLDWNTSGGCNSCTHLRDNQVSGSDGDSSVRQVYRGPVANYLVQIMVQLRIWEDGSEHHELYPEEQLVYPTFPPAPEGITGSVVVGGVVHCHL
jgi:hypothetical protein